MAKLVEGSLVINAGTTIKTLGDSSADYSTLALAIAGSADWDVLQVAPGVYTYDTITHPTEKTIVGMGSPEETILKSTNVAPSGNVWTPSFESVLENLTMETGDGTTTYSDVTSTFTLICRNVTWRTASGATNHSWRFDAPTYMENCRVNVDIAAVNMFIDSNQTLIGCAITQGNAACTGRIFTDTDVLRATGCVFSNASASSDLYSSSEVLSDTAFSGCIFVGTWRKFFTNQISGPLSFTGCDLGGIAFGDPTSATNSPVIRIAGCTNVGIAPPGTDTDIVWDLDRGWRVAKATTYICLGFEDLIACNTTAGAFQVDLPPVAQYCGNRILTIFDEGADGTGNAATNSITIRTSGGTEKVNGSASNIEIGADTGYLSLCVNAAGDEWGVVAALGVAGVTSTVENIVTVAKSGGDYTTIAAGIAASVAGDAIMVYPGTYAEANPLSLKSGTSLIGVGGHEVTTMSCNNAGSHGLLLPDDGEVQHFSIAGASTVGSAGFVFQNGNGDCDIYECQTDSCDIGVLSQSAALTNLVRGFVLHSGSATSGIKVEAGKVLGVTGAYIYAGAGDTIVNAYHATGASAALLLNNSIAAKDPAGTVTNGLLIEQGAHCDVHGVTIHDATNGIHVGTNGGELEALSLDIHSSVMWDVLSNDASTVITIGGGKIDSNLISRTPGDSILGYWQEAFPGDLGTSVQGEFHVGTPYQPAETVLGEGDSTILNMHVFTTNGAGAGFIDETTDAGDGTAYNVFQGVTAGHICYWGVSDREFPGIKLNITTAMVLGAGVVVWEISDGAAGWTAINLLATNSNSPYEQYAQALMVRVENDQIRFDPSSVTFGINTVNGQAAYWLRARITTGITTAPIASKAGSASTKIHTNRWECNSNGYTEFFGGAIKSGALQLGTRYPAAGGSSPGSVTFDVSANVSWVDTDAQFAGAGDAVIWQVPVPPGLDTSREISIDAVWAPSTTDVTGVSMILRAVQLSPGDNMAGALPEITDTQIYTASGTADDVEATVTHSLSIPNALPGETVVLQLERVTASGGGTPAIEVINVSASGYFWS